MRALWIEVDRPGATLPMLDPHIIIESSPGKYHYYFLLEDAPIENRLWESVQQRLVDDYGSDPNAKDRSRILRLSGTYHMKRPEQPHLVNICHESASLPYTWQKILETLPPVIEREQKPITESGDVRKLPEIRAALRYIDSDCDYQDWLSIGIAIHHATFGGNSGLDVWDLWSATGNLYKSGETTYRWYTFNINGNTTGQVTVKTIFKKAQQNGWDNQITSKDAGMPDNFKLVNI